MFNKMFNKDIFDKIIIIYGAHFEMKSECDQSRGFSEMPTFLIIV